MPVIYEKPKIKRFKINRLFNKYNVSINFDNDAVILVGENGIGKTTILSIFYLTITGKYEKLKDYIFDSVVVEVDDKSINRSNYKFTRSEISKLCMINNSRDDIIHYFEKRGSFVKANEYRNVQHILERDFHKIKDKDKKRITKLDLDFNYLKDNFGNKVYYLPTYRRIEEDLENLGYSEDEFRYNKTDSVIKFGMQDVSQRIDNITTEIKNSAVNGLSKVTGEMLKQLVNGLNVNDDQRVALKEGKSIEVMLARVGDNLPQKQREKIKSIINSGEINQKKYEPLVYFLINLMEIYKEQKSADNAIKSFKNVCNQYLYNKTIEYDESQVKIKILHELNVVEPNQLSSGEKQIISLFSKLLLENIDDHYIVIFDEPELSLSIEWQEMILPDIVQTGKCPLLLAATHSPFIYNNVLEQYALDINECIEVIK